MPTGVAVVCESEDCLAVYLAVKTGDTDEERSAAEVSEMARKAAEGDGWVVSFGIGQAVMTCPGCANGRGPVLERGTCQRCMGLVDTESRCVYCLHRAEPAQAREG
ncbi:hypothetical protein ABT173_27395 [Streptomyces sp. NPDC001795]|uniref:hypothetical protein n=1 Tax=Streptomyces sp. NPDC001795 TaxID=3154525 RepID=UPI003317710E